MSKHKGNPPPSFSILEQAEKYEPLHQKIVWPIGPSSPEALNTQNTSSMPGVAPEQSLD